MRQKMRYIVTTLVVFACLSPLLTFARLWQIKEWRIDRLRAHLDRDGWFLQLFGWVRPAVCSYGILSLLIAALVTGMEWTDGEGWYWQPQFVVMVPLGILAWYSLLRIVIGKQVYPVWTLKTLLITLISTCFIGVIGWFLSGEIGFWRALVLMVIPLSTPFLILGSLFAVLPLDRFLKRRIIRKAQNIRRKFHNLTVIGITGSVGKTTTKEILAHILSDRSILVTPAHVNTELGVAKLMIDKLGKEHSIFVVEMGAYCRGEIQLLCSITQPQIGIITFIGNQHLALFGSQEELCRAKGELFQSLPANGYALLNADSPYCSELMSMAPCPVRTVGTGGHATYEAFDIQEDAQGVTFTVRGIPFRAPIHGTHQVSNILLALAAAEALSIPLVESAKRLANFQGVPQTFEKKDGAKGQVVIDDTHNASAASFRAAIEWSRSFPAEEKILVTSGILELGKALAPTYLELGTLCRDVFQKVIFLDKKCVQYFEQGYGKHVLIMRPKRIRAAVGRGTLVVCEGRMPERIVKRFLR